MLKIGIVGLPNVGKSTLFNAVTNSEIEAANYPFATIEPNVKIIEIMDERLAFLADKFNSQKIIYNQIEFVDIAGLVRGASKGEGLGNKFLSNIREVDVIVEVVRFFETNEIIHVENNIDPIRDIEIIELELIVADINQIQKWLEKNEKKISLSKNDDDKDNLNLMIELKQWLEEQKLIKNFFINSIQRQKFIEQFKFLTSKPFIYVANISEEDLKNLNANKFFSEFKKHSEKVNTNFVTLSAQLEYEISKITSNEEREMFLSEYNLTSSGLNELVKMAFYVLDWQTYFTVGPKEAHAWAFKKGMLAPQAAGIIHSDFERGFIKAEVYNYKDFIQFPSEVELKQKGLIRLEGKEYVLNDGDVCNWKFNV